MDFGSVLFGIMIGFFISLFFWALIISLAEYYSGRLGELDAKIGNIQLSLNDDCLCDLCNNLECRAEQCEFMRNGGDHNE